MFFGRLPNIIMKVAIAAASGGVVGLVALRWWRSRLISSTSSAAPIALFFGPATEFIEPVRALLKTSWEIESVSANPAVRAEQAAAATAMIGGLAAANAMLCDSGPPLKLLQCHFTGTDWLDRAAVPVGVPICNATGQEVAIAEWVLGAMLRRVDRIDEEDAAMRTACAAAAAARADLGFAPPFFASPPPPTRSELSSCTVGIVGYGLIGSHVASRAAAFGCRVVATVGRATPPRCPPELEWLGGGGQLHQLLQESDFVVLACPLSTKTTGLIGEVELSLMKPSAYLINIARGPVVDEAALYRSLKECGIGELPSSWVVSGLCSVGSRK